MEVNETSQYKQMMTHTFDNGDGQLLFPLLSKGRIENVLYRAQQGLRTNELLKENIALEIARCTGNSITFPSHFFEFDFINELLAAIGNRSFSIQISPGAELSDYFDQIMALTEKQNFAGIELVMDRAPHEIDLEILKKIPVAKYVFCPVIEIDPLIELKKIPEKILNALYFYFPKKKSSRDSFLSPDGVFVLTEKLRSRGVRCKSIHYFYPDPIENEAVENINKYLENPSSDYYLSQFPNLGKNKRLRSIAIKLAKNTATAPLLWLPFGLIWLLNSPLALLMTLYWKIHDFFDALFLKSCRILSIIRHSIIMSAIYSYVGCIKIFYFFHSLYFPLMHPVWSIKQYLPWLYLVSFHPIFKVYWFLSYQIEKRLLRRNCDEN